MQTNPKISRQQDEKIAFYPGSFDPFTNGHLDIVQRALQYFDKVIIGIGVNEKKRRNFPADGMANAIFDSFIDDPLRVVKIEPVTYSGLTFREAEKYQSLTLIRGIRGPGDFATEYTLFSQNFMEGNIDTIPIFARPEVAYISSSMVRELYNNGEDISHLVPLPVLEFMNQCRKNA